MKKLAILMGAASMVFMLAGCHHEKQCGVKGSPCAAKPGRAGVAKNPFEPKALSSPLGVTLAPLSSAPHRTKNPH